MLWDRKCWITWYMCILSFSRYCQFPKVIVPTYTPTRTVWEFQLLQTQYLVLSIYLSHYSHSGESVVISHLALICIYLTASKIEHLCIFTDNMDIAFREVPIQVFCLVFFLPILFLLVYKSFLHILDTGPLSDICIVNIFYFVSCLFTFLVFLLINKNSCF